MWIHGVEFSLVRAPWNKNLWAWVEVNQDKVPELRRRWFGLPDRAISWSTYLTNKTEAFTENKTRVVQIGRIWMPVEEAIALPKSVYNIESRLIRDIYSSPRPNWWVLTGKY